MDFIHASEKLPVIMDAQWNSLHTSEECQLQQHLFNFSSSFQRIMGETGDAYFIFNSEYSSRNQGKKFYDSDMSLLPTVTALQQSSFQYFLLRQENWVVWTSG